MKATSNVIDFPNSYPGVPVLLRRDIDRQNRVRLARYNTKKETLAINPSTFFKLEVIHFL